MRAKYVEGASYLVDKTQTSNVNKSAVLFPETDRGVFAECGGSYINSRCKNREGRQSLVSTPITERWSSLALTWRPLIDPDG